MNLLHELVTILEEKKDVHAVLKAAGLEDVTHKGMERYERKYKGEIGVQEIHKILTSNGFDMVTHYRASGKPFPKYQVYESPKFKGGTVELHEKNGKIWYVVFDYRTSND